MRYPAPATYFFAPLNERVPVYQKPLTLLQEVVLEGTPQAQAAPKGKEWSLALRPILREPATPPR